MADSIAIALQVAVFAYLVLGDGLLGKYLYDQMQYRLPKDPGARVGFYRAIVALEWGLVGLVALALWLERTPLTVIGLRPAAPGLASAVLPAAVGGIVGGGLLNVALVRFVPARRAQLQRQMDSFQGLVPASGWERLWYAASAITAGICEEVLFRGFLLCFLPVLVPALPGWATIGLAAVIFGVAHMYQGWKGVLQTGLLGLALALLYRYTGTLYGVMILHAAMDLNLLLLTWAVVAPEPRHIR